jgi:hypothetical protein
MRKNGGEYLFGLLSAFYSLVFYEFVRLPLFATPTAGGSTTLVCPASPIAD